MDASEAAAAGGGGLFGIVYFAVMIIMIVAGWKIFVKAGEPGWAVLIPFYNMWVMIRIAGKEWWWFLLLFVPLVNFVAILLVSIGIAEKFGKSALFGIGLMFLGFIFYPVLAFSDAEYQG